MCVYNTHSHTQHTHTYDSDTSNQLLRQKIIITYHICISSALLADTTATTTIRQQSQQNTTTKHTRNRRPLVLLGTFSLIFEMRSPIIIEMALITLLHSSSTLSQTHTHTHAQCTLYLQVLCGQLLLTFCVFFVTISVSIFTKNTHAQTRPFAMQVKRVITAVHKDGSC